MKAKLGGGAFFLNKSHQNYNNRKNGVFIWKMEDHKSGNVQTATT